MSKQDIVTDLRARLAAALAEIERMKVERKYVQYLTSFPAEDLDEVRTGARFDVMIEVWPSGAVNSAFRWDGDIWSPPYEVKIQ